MGVGQTVAVDEEPVASMPTWEELRDPERWQAEMEKATERVRSLKRRVAELKKRHWETWSAVKRAVDDADPECFLAIGTPRDQYDDAVVYLTDRVLANEHLSLESVSDWFQAFYGSAPPDADAIRRILIRPAP
jgi:hypothetical protein